MGWFLKKIYLNSNCISLVLNLIGGLKKIKAFVIFLIFLLMVTPALATGDPDDMEDGIGGIPLDDKPGDQPIEEDEPTDDPVVVDNPENPGTGSIDYYYPTTQELDNGYTKCIKNDRRIYLYGSEYYLGVVDVMEDSVLVFVSGNGQTEISLSEEVKFDLDGDGVNDILVRLDGFCSENFARIYIESFSPEVEESSEEVEVQTEEVTGNVESNENKEIEPTTNAITGFVSAVRDNPGTSSFVGIIGLILIGMISYKIKKNYFSK